MELQGNRWLQWQWKPWTLFQKIRFQTYCYKYKMDPFRNGFHSTCWMAKWHQYWKNFMGLFYIKLIAKQIIWNKIEKRGWVYEEHKLNWNRIVRCRNLFVWLSALMDWIILTFCTLFKENGWLEKNSSKSVSVKMNFSLITLFVNFCFHF